MNFIDTLLCRLGLHTWGIPGTQCTLCEYPDTRYDSRWKAIIRVTEWHATISARIPMEKSYEATDKTY